MNEDNCKTCVLLREHIVLLKQIIELKDKASIQPITTFVPYSPQYGGGGGSASTCQHSYSAGAGDPICVKCGKTGGGAYGGTGGMGGGSSGIVGQNTTGNMQ